MTLQEAMAHQPQWVVLWLKWLFFGVFILPLALLVWRQTRIAGAATFLASVAGAFSVGWLYDELGYVKLLGLPHIVLWTPLVIYMVALLRRADMPKLPRWIMAVVLVTILISLAFECQMFDEIPMQDHDIFMDKVVTEARVYDGIGRGTTREAQ